MKTQSQNRTLKSINVDPELHKVIKMACAANGMEVKDYVRWAVETAQRAGGPSQLTNPAIEPAGVDVLQELKTTRSEVALMLARIQELERKIGD